MVLGGLHHSKGGEIWCAPGCGYGFDVSCGACLMYMIIKDIVGRVN